MVLLFSYFFTWLCLNAWSNDQPHIYIRDPLSLRFTTSHRQTPIRSLDQRKTHGPQSLIYSVVDSRTRAGYLAGSTTARALYVVSRIVAFAGSVNHTLTFLTFYTFLVLVALVFEQPSLWFSTVLILCTLLLEQQSELLIVKLWPLAIFDSSDIVRIFFLFVYIS